MASNLVKDIEEVAQWHLGGIDILSAITAAVPARQVTPQGTLPEKLLKRMLTTEPIMFLPRYLKCYFLAVIHASISHRGPIY